MIAEAQQIDPVDNLADLKTEAARLVTVKGYMGTVLAAVRRAHLQGWLESPPVIRKIQVSKIKAMKGRPISTGEFDRMLDTTVVVVGPEAAPSWRYVLWGLWASALRLEELMAISWDIPGTIRPNLVLILAIRHFCTHFSLQRRAPPRPRKTRLAAPAADTKPLEFVDP